MPIFELMDSGAQAAIIKVIGVGGGGGNAVQHMVNSGIAGVDFICTNTDAQALGRFEGAKSLQIGSNITKGSGQFPIISCSQGITIIFNHPKVVFFSQFNYSFYIPGIS